MTTLLSSMSRSTGGIDEPRAVSSYIGIDFGTTNTSLGLADGAGGVRLAQLPGRSGGVTTTWRTVLYFAPDSTVLAGAPAIDRYAENEGEGRLVQSIKSHLASAAFTRTTISGKTWTLEALIAEFLWGLRAGAGAPLGARAVVGRPVRYWGAGTDLDDARAVGRMRAALLAAGFTDVVFEFEPIAAALRYAARLDHDELLLVADFGGGTSDFSLVRVGPGVSPGDPNAILATGGLAIGGDAFDARIIDAVVAPALGRERLVRVVKEDLGLSLHQSVEGSKQALSGAGSTRLSCAELDLVVTSRFSNGMDWVSFQIFAVARHPGRLPGVRLPVRRTRMDWRVFGPSRCR
jgi:hypothetical chaperone protein